ncbi:MAG: PAS domain S-box protein, partial [Candidatus Thermoplasmatota archaeon]
MSEVCHENKLKGANDSSLRYNTDDARYKTLFQQVNAAAFLASLDGRILEANQKACDLFGYSWDGILRLSLRDFLTRDLNWSQFMEDIAAQGGLHTETEVICKDGNYIAVEISVSLFRMSGKPVMFVLIWDITDRRRAEQKLRESEKKYRGLFEFTTDGILVLNARGDIIDANTRICELLDVKKDELIGKNMFNLDVFTSSSYPIVLRQFEQLLSERTAKSYTTEIRNKAGKVLEVDISSFFLIKDGEVDNFVLIIRDCTEKNEAEKRREMEHDLLKTLMEYIPDSIYFKDERNRFILVNKAKAMHSNVTPEEMIGKTDYDFLPREQAEKLFQEEECILRSGQSIINKVEHIIYPDGSEKWVSVTKIPRFNSEGEIIGTMGISRDITLYEQMKIELQKSEARYKAVFDNSSFAIVITDEEGRIISWNHLFEDLYQGGYTDLYLKPIENLYPPEEWDKIQSTSWSEQYKNQCCETKMYRNDKSVIDITLSKRDSTTDTDGYVGSIIIIQDISKSKHMEEEAKKTNELLQTLMDNIPDSIYFKDEQNKFILVNKAKAEHWHTTPEQMIGKT